MRIPHSPIIICGVLILVVVGKLVSTCVRSVYCYGELLKTIQLTDPCLYEDSKEFVDKKMKYSQDKTLYHFNELMEKTQRKPTSDQLLQFVNDYFENSNELEETELIDWVPSPTILDYIHDNSLKEWVRQINSLWRSLARKVSEDVKAESERYSLLYVPNQFIVPGGRFRELYYWDTYWIIQGLLLCNMTKTVKGIIENFFYLKKRYGIVPNGGRVYYLNRSQPPLLIPMVANYLVSTNDIDFIRANINTLEDEFNFWMNNRTVQVTRNGKTYTLARYYAVSDGPRPEAYREDYAHAQNLDSEEKRWEFYKDIISGAESGWDFSSRWIIRNGTNNGKFTDIHTRDIIPVDLNSFIFLNAEILSTFYISLGDYSKAEEYARKASQWKEAVTDVCWDDAEGSWFDYDIANNVPRKYFYPSNFVPLWVKCYDERNIASVAGKVVTYLKKNKITYYLGGIPASLNETGEQWDHPNAWPPLQAFVIQGLERTREATATELAFDFAKQWINANYKGYLSSQNMYEKYRADSPGEAGDCGEYKVQSGFGWTNGVILELLAAYGDRLRVESNNCVQSFTGKFS